MKVQRRVKLSDVGVGEVFSFVNPYVEEGIFVKLDQDGYDNVRFMSLATFRGRTAWDGMEEKECDIVGVLSYES